MIKMTNNPQKLTARQIFQKNNTKIVTKTDRKA
jgi:hypothetical protein